MKLLLKFLTSSELWITVPNESTVYDLKKEVDLKLDYSPVRQLIFFKGKRLQDDKTLVSYGIVTDSTLKLVIKSDAMTDKTTNNITNQTSTNADNLTTKKFEVSSPSVSSTSLNSLLLTFLQKHYHQKDSEKILDQFNKNYDSFIKSLTLKDIDEVARVNLERNQ